MPLPPPLLWRGGGAGPNLLKRSGWGGGAVGLKGSREPEGKRVQRVGEVGVWTISKAWQGNGVTSGARGIQGFCGAEELVRNKGEIDSGGVWAE